MTNLSKTVLARIHQRRVTPRPRWHFVLRNLALWCLALATIALASLGLGSLLSDLLAAEWALAPRYPGGVFGIVQQAVGLLFVLAVALGLVATVVFVRSTRRGYRYGLTSLLLMLLGTVLVAGASLLPTGVPGHLRDLHDRHVPRVVLVSEMHQPSQGRVLGELYTDETGTVYLAAVTGETYQLWLMEDAPVLPSGFVVVFGELIADDIFAALQLRPVPPYISLKELPGTLRITQ